MLWQLEINNWDGRIYESDLYGIEHIKEIASTNNVDVRDVFENAINYFSANDVGKHDGKFCWWLKAFEDDEDCTPMLNIGSEELVGVTKSNWFTQRCVNEVSKEQIVKEYEELANETQS
jgi:hypothetical protein